MGAEYRDELAVSSRGKVLPEVLQLSFPFTSFVLLQAANSARADGSLEIFVRDAGEGVPAERTGSTRERFDTRLAEVASAAASESRFFEQNGTFYSGTLGVQKF